MRKKLEELAKEILLDNVLMYDVDINVDAIVASKSNEELKEIIIGRWVA